MYIIQYRISQSFDKRSGGGNTKTPYADALLYMYHKFLRFPEPKFRAVSLALTESLESSIPCTKGMTTELFSSARLSCSVSKLTVDQRITFTLLNA